MCLKTEPGLSNEICTEYSSYSKVGESIAIEGPAIEAIVSSELRTPLTLPLRRVRPSWGGLDQLLRMLNLHLLLKQRDVGSKSMLTDDNWFWGCIDLHLQLQRGAGLKGDTALRRIISKVEWGAIPAIARLELLPLGWWGGYGLDRLGLNELVGRWEHGSPVVRELREEAIGGDWRVHVAGSLERLGRGDRRRAGKVRVARENRVRRAVGMMEKEGVAVHGIEVVEVHREGLVRCINLEGGLLAGEGGSTVALVLAHGDDEEYAMEEVARL